MANTTTTVTLRKDFIRCYVHANPRMNKEKASKVYDALCASFPEITRGGHRGMVGRMKPWETLEHECPYCGKTSQGFMEIDAEFGRRVFRGKLYFQSWCRDCRKAGHKKSQEDPSFNKRLNPLVQNVHTN